MESLTHSNKPINVFALYIGQQIVARRKAIDINQEDLAKALGVARSSVANIESGRQGCTAMMLWKLARVLKCSIDDFFPEKIPIEAQVAFEVTEEPVIVTMIKKRKKKTIVFKS